VADHLSRMNRGQDNKEPIGKTMVRIGSAWRKDEDARAPGDLLPGDPPLVIGDW
jgi:hypothetical protein